MGKHPPGSHQPVGPVDPDPSAACNRCGTYAGALRNVAGQPAWLCAVCIDEVTQQLSHARELRCEVCGVWGPSKLCGRCAREVTR